MSGHWKLMVAVSVLLWIGCAEQKTEEPTKPEVPDTPDAMETGERNPWLDVDCHGQIVEQRLQGIMAMAEPAKQHDPMAGEAQMKARECMEHVVGVPVHVDRVFAAWNAAQGQDWPACVSELTHGNDGGGLPNR